MHKQYHSSMSLLFYTLLMILLSYIMVDRIVVWMFLPIKYCLSSLRVKFDPISSLLTTFATFFFLSFCKMTITSLMLLSSTHLLAPNGTVIRRVFVYDATLDYFGPGHLPYGFLVAAVAIVFVVLPLILVFLYPTGLLQNKLRFLCSFRQAQTLTTFMEIYMGHFKDGTEGSRDYCYFAGGQLLARVVGSFLIFHTHSTLGWATWPSSSLAHYGA